jgi:hypothetical protein
VTAVALRPAGQQLALAGDDHAIRIWDLDQRRVVATLDGHNGWVRGLAFSADGTRLASAGQDGRVIGWDTTSWSKAYEHQGERAWSQLMFDRSGGRLMSIGFRSPMRIVDGSTGRELAALDCPCADMRAVACSPDNRLVAGGGRNGRLRIWELDSGRVLAEVVAHRQRIRSLEFSPAGDRLASCGEDGVIRLWHADGRPDDELRVDGSKVMTLVFCGERELACGGSDNLVRVWDLDKRQETARLTGHTGSVAALAYGDNLLVSSAFDSEVRIWRRARSVAGDAAAPSGRIGDRAGSGAVAR